MYISCMTCFHTYIYIYITLNVCRTPDPYSVCARENVGRHGSFPHGIDIVVYIYLHIYISIYIYIDLSFYLSIYLSMHIYIDR